MYWVFLARCGFLLDGNPVPVKALPEANVVLEKLQGTDLIAWRVLGHQPTLKIQNCS